MADPEICEPAMTARLAPLRTRLADLRRRRWRLRVGGAAAQAAFILLWSLALVFSVDLVFEFNRLQRLILLAGLAAVSVWSWRKIMWPALRICETELDMALFVEKQQRIDSDLVAALQFETYESRRWGSPGLQEAVVDYVADFADEMDVFQGLDVAQTRRRLLAAGMTWLLFALAGALYPGHVGAFVNRMLLGSAHYPTRTVIERIVLNGQTVYPAAGPIVPFRMPFGRHLRAEVDVLGVVPESGRLRLRGSRHGLHTTVELTPAERTGSAEPRLFTGTFPRLTDDVTYQIFLGDAWTDPAPIEVIPLPVVSVILDETPPAYVIQAEDRTIKPGALQISVIEGSDVSLRVACRNKPLQAATLVIEMKEYPLAPVDESRRVWKPSAAATPLSSVLQPLAFEVRVVDDDGLAPEQPLSGRIHLEADRPPRVVAGMTTEQVLPTARPGIAYGVTDDYGIAELRLRRQIVRRGGPIDESVATVTSGSEVEPISHVLQGRYVLDLKPLGLVKGDEVRLTLEAVDFRGERLGMIGQSETLVLHVTDESGILAGLAETDEKSARQLDQIIQRQLGIGEAR
jgi:hypothetical protein